MIRSCGRCLVVLWLVALAGTAVGEPLTVTVQPPRVRTELFDPENPPPQRPRMQEGEAAVTASRLGAAASMRAAVLQQQRGEDGCRATVRIESVDVTTELVITIWLPHDYTQKLKDHEQGHRRIAEHFYKDARTRAQELGRPFIGRTFSAEGEDCSAAVDAAIRQAIEQFNAELMESIQTPTTKAQQIYDELTDHGRNELTEERAIEQAIGRATSPE